MRQQIGIHKEDGIKPQTNFKDYETIDIKELFLQDRLAFFKMPNNWKPGRLTLKSHPGQAMCLDESRKVKHAGHDVHWMKLGPREDALKVY